MLKYNHFFLQHCTWKLPLALYWICSRTILSQFPKLLSTSFMAQHLLYRFCFPKLRSVLSRVKAFTTLPAVRFCFIKISSDWLNLPSKWCRQHQIHSFSRSFWQPRVLPNPRLWIWFYPWRVLQRKVAE